MNFKNNQKIVRGTADILVKISSISKFRALVLMVAMLASSVLVLLVFFKPSDDYAIYTHFAEAVVDGQNPYRLPAEYRTTTVKKIMPLGWTQPEPGLVRQNYADYPPLLMLINSIAYRVNEMKGIYWMCIAIYAASCLMCFKYYFSTRPYHDSAAIFVLAFLYFNPFALKHLFFPVEDKVWFIFFIMTCLVFRSNQLYLTVVLAMFAALKGLGFVMIFFYFLYLWRCKQIECRKLIHLIMIFLVITIFAHMPFFPEWLSGYQWRAQRQNFVGHESIFVPLQKIGLYSEFMPKLFTAGSMVLVAFLIYRRRLKIEYVLLLPVIISIVFNAELGYDRLLVALAALLILCRNIWVVAGGYILVNIGILILVAAKFFGLVAGEMLHFVIVWSFAGWLFLHIFTQIKESSLQNRCNPHEC